MGWLSAGIPDNEIENSNVRLTTPTEKKAGAFSGAVSAVPKGIGAGLAKVVETISDSPLSTPLDFLGYGVTGAADIISEGSSDTFEQYREKQAANRETNLKATYDYLSPTVDDGIVSNVLYGLGDYLTRAAVGTTVGGIGGAAAVTGASDYNFITNDLVRKGVDLPNARVAGAVQGATSAILTATPLSFVRGGASVGRQAADAVVAIGAPVILDSAGRTYNQNRLADKGYTDQAKQFEVTPETVITGLALGGVMHSAARYVKNKQATATNAADLAAQAEAGVIPDDGVVSVTPDDVTATQARTDQINNMLAINQILFNEDASVPIHAPTPFQINHHLQNMRAATDQLLNGQPVNVPNNLQGTPKINLPGQASAVAAQASASGVNPNTALLISHIETGGTFNPKAQNPNSSANGLFQVIDSSWKRLGGGDRSSVSEQIRVGLAHMKEVAGALRNTLKREPQVHEEYMGHLLGAGGASKVLTADPNARLYDVVYGYTRGKTAAQRAKTAQDVVNNNGMKGLTVGQAIAKWQNKAADVQAKIGISPTNTRAYGMDGSEHSFTYEFRSADDLITSNNQDFSLNSLYPPELQPRDRTRESSRQQVESMADSIRPELLADSFKLSDGAPIIGSDLVVESGNGRSMALKRAYEQGKGESYRQYLQDNADRFGLNRSDLDGISNPVLVRRRVSDVQDRAAFARLANESDVAQMSSTERAQSDAARLPDSSKLKINNDGTLNLDGSIDYVRQFVQGLPKSEQGTLIGKNGLLSQEGKRRLETALVQQAYKDKTIVERLTENLDDNSKNVLAALLKNAPRIAQLDELVRQGGRHSNTIATDVSAAAAKFSDLRANGLKVDDYLNQGQLIDDGLSVGARDLLAEFGTGRSSKQIDEAIGRRVDEIESMGDPRQGDMFGDIPEVMAANQALDTMGDMQIAITRENANGEIETITMSARERMAELEGEMKQADEIGVAAQAAATCALQFGV